MIVVTQNKQNWELGKGLSAGVTTQKRNIY